MRLAGLCILAASLLQGCSTQPAANLPGPLADGRTRLPNGWYLSPAGKQVPVGELPLNMAVSPDERYVILNNNGTGEHSLTVVETGTWTVLQTLPVNKAFLGMKLTGGGKTLYLSGGNDNRVLVFTFANGRLALVDSIALGAPRPKQLLWAAGLDVDERNGRLFVAGRESDSLYAVDLNRKAVASRCSLPAKPYTCLLSRDGGTLYVSLWGGSAIALLDPSSLALKGTIRVGDHPCDMVESPDGARLFVANANHNTVSVVSLRQKNVLETVCTALTPSAPYGSTPNALALSDDGRRLFVANADNNYIALFDVSEWQKSRSLGFIPVGWYPTVVRFLASSGTILVANGKGGGSRANPGGPNPTRDSRTSEYIGSLFKGSLSAIPNPTAEHLAAYTAGVFANSPYNDRKKDAPGTSADNPVPSRVGGPSPIKHVFYIIKENRTYDQVFGDIKEGNGDPNLCLFPDSATPNHHALVRQFVLLDNFYCDAEVSADGHEWSMGAYVTDYTEKTWPTMYGGRGGEYEFEGARPITYPSGGYLWDNCSRNGVSYRTYGEWTENPSKPGDSAKALMPSLVGHVAPHYVGWDMKYSDLDRVKAWMAEFDEYDTNGMLPSFQVIKLPNDHTEGTTVGSLTPRAFVAQNDQALGQIVERISRSRYWRESAIFVIEDDAQNGPDHVDAHRTVALAISPWTKQGHVDSELYSTSSMVRTMELILGLPPMSQFDAAATPMYASFATTPDTTPYRCRKANVPLDEKNAPGAYGQERSGQMDFSAEDRIPEVEFSEIIWRSVKGANVPMPPPVRSAFVKVRDAGEEK
jgi:DNA-binding beta-propeller fold protein YncE/phospholipase C